VKIGETATLTLDLVPCQRVSEMTRVSSEPAGAKKRNIESDDYVMIMMFFD
jgi:hypothetical protein